MKRVYHEVIEHHLAKYRQMVFLSGPRQVGKTTIAQSFKETYPNFAYLNWDAVDHRAQILGSSKEMVSFLFQNRIFNEKPLIVFDEIHKYKSWKNYLKGFYDIYSNEYSIIVTGSSRLNIDKKGGDSLMGRYFQYRVHPLSVREILQPHFDNSEIRTSIKVEPHLLSTLLELGGFPDPFTKQDRQYLNIWQDTRLEQLIREDIRDLHRALEIGQLEVLVHMLRQQAGRLVNYSELAKKIRVADVTIRAWIKILEASFYCFTLKPWSKNIARALIKQPKIYLWDWSMVEDKGYRIENMVACHLHKWVQFLTDTGIGKYELYFVRDKNKNEVDFLVSKNGAPWLLIETKTGDNTGLNPKLEYFQKQLKSAYAFQLDYDMPYMEFDFRDLKSEVKILPMSTFLSQLI